MVCVADVATKTTDVVGDLLIRSVTIFFVRMVKGILRKARQLLNPASPT